MMPSLHVHCVLMYAVLNFPDHIEQTLKLVFLCLLSPKGEKMCWTDYKDVVDAASSRGGTLVLLCLVCISNFPQLPKQSKECVRQCCHGNCIPTMSISKPKMSLKLAHSFAYFEQQCCWQENLIFEIWTLTSLATNSIRL